MHLGVHAKVVNLAFPFKSSISGLHNKKNASRPRCAPPHPCPKITRELPDLHSSTLHQDQTAGADPELERGPGKHRLSSYTIWARSCVDNKFSSRSPMVFDLSISTPAPDLHSAMHAELSPMCAHWLREPNATKPARSTAMPNHVYRWFCKTVFGLT